ncbi:MAG TPA: hypothetical protein VHS97_23675, partial [Isosphaeraceae bacterium]|jgi:hypothetical protein|nr:hypothetical protein [Isosphaeraceae bacterium]
LTFFGATAADAQITNCFRNGFGISCYTNPTYPTYQGPSVAQQFLDGFAQGRMERHNRELQLENERLRRQLGQ